jgi:DNA-binding response OmpR family regulator
MQLSESGADIIVLDVGFSGTRTGAIIEQIKGDERFKGIIIILFSGGHTQLRRAFPERGALNKADDVCVRTFDESELIDRIESAARHLRMERSQYRREVHESDGLYTPTSRDERRKDKRFKPNAPVTVRGKDMLGEPFEEETVMLDSSAGGAYLKTEFHVEHKSELEISVHEPGLAEGVLTIRGTVVRRELGSDRFESKPRRVAVRFADELTQNFEFHLLLAQLAARAEAGPP